MSAFIFYAAAVLLAFPIMGIIADALAYFDWKRGK